MTENKTVYCSFCGKNQRQVKQMIAAQDVHICDECVELCNSIIDKVVPRFGLSKEIMDRLATMPVPSFRALLRQIKERTDDTVTDGVSALDFLRAVVYTFKTEAQALIEADKTREEKPA